jgi:hypothetical protein
MSVTGAAAGRRRSAWWIGFAVAATAVAVLAAVVTWRARQAPPLAQYEHVFPDEYVGTVWFTVQPEDDEDRQRQVRVAWGRLGTSFVSVEAGPVTYLVTKGAGNGIRTEPLQVSVDPGARVTFGYGEAPAGARDLSATPWEAAPASSGVAPSEPARGDSTMARAAVDESVSYGGHVVEGVGAREAPTRESERVTLVWHGEVHEADCWVQG